MSQFTPDIDSSGKRTEYRTAPKATTEMPTGIPHIIGNEAAERFSYYGMRAILVIFMTQYLKDSSGEISTMSDEDAKVWYHQFVSWAYAFPIIGALLSDIFLGKYRTIMLLSIVYCVGHLSLAIDETRNGLFVGLVLIAVGAGGIKPCVSAHVGDQFGRTNQHLLSRVFGWFYFAINIGAFVSMMLTPVILKTAGPHWAFGIPGVLMLIATIVFWRGRHEFVHVPPGGLKFIDELFSGVGIVSLVRLGIVYLFIAVFFSIYDQNGSDWVLQAKSMDRTVFGVELLPSQIQAVNSILVLIYIPLFSYVLYPFLDNFFLMTPLRKIGLGFFITVPTVLIIAMVEHWIGQGKAPTIMWHLLAYVLLTAAEVMIYQTGLEYSYTQAPNTMKSFIMGLFLLSIALGNQFTSLFNFFIQNADGSRKLDGVSYFLFFAVLMLVTSLIFAVIAKFIPEKSFMQQESSADK